MTKQHTFKAKVFSSVIKHNSYYVGVTGSNKKITAFDALLQPNTAICIREIEKAPIRQKKAVLSEFLKAVECVTDLYNKDYDNA